MRVVGKQEIEDMAIGAALLGTGGGGDPYIGKLMALQAIEEYGPITLLSVNEVPDDVFVVSTGMLGAPSVMIEKVPNGNEAKEALETLEHFMGKKVFAIYPIEAGGLNSMLPLALAARLGLPVVDVDGMGRAFPEMQMVTFDLDGIQASPFVIADEKGNVTLLKTIDNLWAERIARAATIQKGGAVMFAVYPMTGRNLKESGIHDSLKLAEEIGRTIRLSKEGNRDPIQEILSLTGGFELFRGKVMDINRKTEAGFLRGTAKLEGLATYKGDVMELRFQNEHLLAKTQDRLLCITPDLIAVVDAETAIPITTEGLRYGSRAVVIGIPCHPKWRTAKGIETCGPRYFGYDIDYTPVETLIENGVALK